MTDTSEQLTRAFLTAHTVWNPGGIIAGCSSPSLDEWSAFASALRTPRQLDAEVVARVQEAMEEPDIESYRGHGVEVITLRLSDVKAMLEALT